MHSATATTDVMAIDVHHAQTGGNQTFEQLLAVQACQALVITKPRLIQNSGSHMPMPGIITVATVLVVVATVATVMLTTQNRQLTQRG